MSRTVEIPLSRGYVALIDAADEQLVVENAPWHATAPKRRGTMYARHRRPSGIITMHVLLMGRVGIDHINGDGLDNRRANLRFATPQENNRNHPGHGARSGFKGVYPITRSSRWFASIRVDGVGHYLGAFDTPEAAAYAYDDAAIRHFGEFARLNFPVTNLSVSS